MADPQKSEGSNTLTDTQLERLKMYQDSFKHMTTFSSGGILLSAAVTGALFPKPVFPVMLALSIFLLAFGAFAAMAGLVLVPGQIDLAIAGSETELRLVRKFLRGSVFAAYNGLWLFAFFATVNLVLP